MVKRDLERVGIPYENKDGIAEFHASGRHTYITELLRNGASLPEAKELARHSEIKTTMRYTHIGINDQTPAIAALGVPQSNGAAPLDTPHASTEADPALQMRCNFGGVGSHSLALDGNLDGAHKRQNPRN